MTNRSRPIIWLCGFIFLSCFCSNALAADHLTLIVGGVQKVVYLPAKLAEQLGYFKDEGLDVDLQSVTSGTMSATALLSGSADGVIGAYEQTIHIQARGKYVTTIAQISLTPQEVLVVGNNSGIKTIADLKGKVIGVTDFGSLTYFLAQDLLARVGLQRSDVTFLAIGAGGPFVAAMEQGRISAGVGTDPDISVMTKGNIAHVLVDMRKPDDSRNALGGDYPGASLYVNADWIKQHPEDAEKLAHAISRALQFIATHSAEEIADRMPAAYSVGDKALYVLTIAAAKPSFSPDGRMPADGPQTVMNILSKFGGIDPSKIDLARTYTNQFIGP
jgi:NitT/TauT family transport system substrate-binding protein